MGIKTNLWAFQATNKQISHKRLGHSKERETESLLVAAQNNVIRTNEVKVRIVRHNKIADVDFVVVETNRSIPL